MIKPTGFALSLALTLGTLVSARAAGLIERSQEDVKLLRYVTAGPDGAVARNLFDKKGLELRKIEPGQILAVYGENGAFLEVEVPGGFPVWVYGKFLRPTNDPNVYEVAGNDVLQRPRPSSDPSNWPLRQKLFSRDRVRAIQRNDPSKDLSEDWVQVWSPSGVRAWVDAAETEPLENEREGATLWARAVVADKELTGSVDPSSAAREAGAPNGAAAAQDEGQQAALATLGAADDMFAAEKARENPDFTGVRAAYEVLLQSLPAGSTADLVRGRLREVDAREQALAIKREFEEELREHQAGLDKREQELRAAGSDVDPLGGDRFVARGWLERLERHDAPPVYILRWGGQIVAELVCSGGRYDLDVFENFELGVRGNKLAKAASPGTILAPSVRVIDASRIEVLSGRGVQSK